LPAPFQICRTSSGNPRCAERSWGTLAP
jgi:hypothetical protein